MSFDWPNHPLFEQLCEKAKLKLPKLGFELFQVNEGNISFSAEHPMIVLIQHEGYDMPSVYFGNEKNPKVCKSWGPLEYFINPEIPICKKHKELKTFYDFEFEFDLILNYQTEIIGIINSPEAYKLWMKVVDISELFKLIDE